MLAEGWVFRFTRLSGEYTLDDWRAARPGAVPLAVLDGDRLAFVEDPDAIPAKAGQQILSLIPPALAERLREHERSGIDLPEDAQRRLREINARLAGLSTDFDQRLVAGRNAAAVHLTDEAHLAGLGDQDRAGAARAARDAGFVDVRVRRLLLDSLSVDAASLARAVSPTPRPGGVLGSRAVLGAALASTPFVVGARLLAPRIRPTLQLLARRP